ncbi:IPT/TIG domain-containing protein [Heterostelium album PN500]|uniref:IPT/TIG domain-containing protein n=1 Tax=Heterostelium pallidum (strain ATCC 26659 / Pp 5 / PN500) TaxID=670386 RepID=D3B8F2_HETP5|nr:IPT/TIG domain-containing protein [Heterostelium album PN500]EFA82320.1 IPT/TIG domain-containing protein [Heterostelium album PN500]|eukprot:XP_020434437.1 IPT/TIG domain-containing protein [Heterostelium album PN500]
MSVQNGPDGVTFTLKSGSFSNGNYLHLVRSNIKKTMTILNPTTAIVPYTSDIINIVDSFQTCDSPDCGSFLPLTWYPPYIANISSIPTQGGIITVKGISLLSSPPGSSKIYFHDRYSLNESDTNADGTEIHFNADQSIISLISGQNIPIYLQISGFRTLTTTTYFFNQKYFSFQTPTISLVEFNKDTNQITMTGTNFGVNGIPLTLTSNGGNLQPTHLINNTVIVSNVNAQNYSFSGDYQYVLNVGSPNPNSATYTQQLYPVVTSVTSTSSSGGTISIYGYRLNLFKPNATISQVSIIVGGYTCTVLTLNDPTNSFIACSMPAIPSGSKNYNLSVVVSIDGKNSNSDILFSADLPSVQEVSQDSGNTIIIGSSFGNDTKSIVLHFNGSTPMSPISVSDSMLTFKFPPNTPSGVYNGNTLTKFNTSPTVPFKITIQPYITSITSPPTQGGIVTISGQYMTSNIQGNENITVIINDPNSNLNTPCSNATRLNITSVTCIAPQGSGTSVYLQLQLNGISATVLSGLSMVYQAPKVLSATSVSPYGGAISIFGTNLGFTNIDLKLITVSIDNSRDCKATQVIDNTNIVCQLKSGQFNLPPPINYLNLTVTVNGQTSFNSTVFKLDNTVYYELLNRVLATDYSEIEYRKQKLYGIIFPACLLVPVLIWSTVKLCHHQISYKQN